MELRLKERQWRAAGTAGGPWPLDREEVGQGGGRALILSWLVLSTPLLSPFSSAL